MNKLAATLRVAIASSLLIYLNTLTVMFLPYCNISPFFIQLGFVALCTISILVSFAAILHKNRSVFQSVLRWFFTLVFFVGFFLLSAYTGLVELLCNLFNINTNSSADNASGLLTLSYFFVVFISGFLIVLWKLSTILLRKLTARRKTP